MIRKQEIKLKGTIINQNNLCDLLCKIEKIYSKYKINVQMQDGSSLEKLTIDEFKKYNFSNRIIEDIDISFYDENSFYNEIRIDKNIFESYRISFASEKEEEYAVIKDLIETWVVQNKSRKCIDFVHSVWLLSLIVFVMVMPTTLIFAKIFNLTTLVAMSSVSVLVLGLVGYGLWCFTKFLYPLVEIDIGTNQHKKLRKSLGWVLTVIVIPTIIAIILEIVL